MTTGIILIGIFLLFAFLMYSKRLPALVALPLLAIVITMIAYLPHYFNLALASNDLFLSLFLALGNALQYTFNTVLVEGVPRLAGAIMTVVLGGVFSYILKITGISEKLVRKTAEFAGDNPFVISLLLVLIVALLFTTLGGLGAIILTANIFFPVLLSLGVPPVLTGSLFLMAVSFGGIFNMINWALYIDILKINVPDILKFALPFGLIFAFLILIFTIIEFKKANIKISYLFLLFLGLFFLFLYLAYLLITRFLVIDSQVFVYLKSLYIFILTSFFILPFLGRSFKWISSLAPIIPLSLVLILGWQINAAFILGIIFLLFCDTKHLKKGLSILTEASVEGVKEIAPAIVLMIGIGMVLIASMQTQVQLALQPIINFILPKSNLAYVLFFTILAPLSLYRGPLNIWGMGSGLIALLKNAYFLKPTLIMSAFLSTGQLQGVCDPTNTYNVWTANQLKIGLNAILKKTMPYMWLLAFFGLVLAVNV